MINTREIIDFIQKNKGETVRYGAGYSIQVYDGDVLQANISYKAEQPFLKIEQRVEGSIDVFLEEIDREGIIDYSHSCRLADNETIAGLFNTFSSHPQIEKALISLLELH